MNVWLRYWNTQLTISKNPCSKAIEKTDDDINRTISHLLSLPDHIRSSAALILLKLPIWFGWGFPLSHLWKLNFKKLKLKPTTKWFQRQSNAHVTFQVPFEGWCFIHALSPVVCVGRWRLWPRAWPIHMTFIFIEEEMHFLSSYRFSMRGKKKVFLFSWDLFHPPTSPFYHQRSKGNESNKLKCLTSSTSPAHEFPS